MNLPRSLLAAVSPNCIRAVVGAPPWSWPSVLPAAWRSIEPPPGIGGESVAAWMRADGLAVIGAIEHHEMGGRWIHVSLSRRNRLPSWADVRDVKDLFVGRDRTAVQVLPREELYVNEHPHCFHLWSCLDSPQMVPDDAL